MSARPFANIWSAASLRTALLVETAAHLTDHVFPRLPVRQWVLSVPKRLRYFMQRDGAVLNMVLRIFLQDELQLTPLALIDRIAALVATPCHPSAHRRITCGQC